MKIALINPDSPGLINPKVFPPLGILYISAVLKQQGHQVEVVDLAGKGPRALPRFKTYPEIVGITATTPQFPQAVHMLQYLKEKRITTMIGGPHATVDVESCRRAGFDGIGIGACEETIDTIIQDIGFKIKPTLAHGFIDIGQHKNYLDNYPFPDRDAIDLNSYEYTLDGRKCTNIISSRGCPYHCAFCCKSWGTRVRYRSVENVLKEAELLKTKYDYNALMFYDDEMLMNKARDFQIFGGLKELDITFRFFSRINLIKQRSPEVLKLLGCKQICFGIESGSDYILRNINKGFNTLQARDVIKWCKDADLSVKLFMIVGLPGENKRSLQKTKEFLEETKPDDVDFTVLTVYPGSDIYNNPDKYDLKWKYVPNWYKTAPGKYITNVSTSKLTSQEIIEARDNLEERFKKW